MSDNDFFYSDIISPADYNNLMTHQHLYISASDKYIKNQILEKQKNSADKKLVTVELGCGPGRICDLVYNENISLTCLEFDPTFYQYAKQNCHPNINFLNADATNHEFSEKVDVFYSQGFHHHIPKGKKTQDYLNNVFNSLTDSGIYLLSDEFIPEYSSEEERQINLVIWYSHIIYNASKSGYFYLAQEEAKTMIDDIYEGEIIEKQKNQEKITKVLTSVEKIALNSNAENLNNAKILAYELISYLKYNSDQMGFGINSADKTISASRHDYKICEKILAQELKESGLVIKSKKFFGPAIDIGGMIVYTISK